MRPAENDLVTLGPWGRGGNNIAAETSVPPASFRRGINVDVYPGGKVRRRQGAQLVLPVSGGANRGWSDGRAALYRSGGALYRFTPDAPELQLTTSIDPEGELVFGSVNQFIYVSDGTRAFAFDPATNVLRPWGVSSPNGQPTLTANAAGGLDAGTYQVAVTFATADGEESGTGLAATVKVDQGGGIMLSHMPTSYESHVAYINVYMTRINGEVFFLYGRVAIGSGGMLLSRQRLGRKLETQHLRTLPPATSGMTFVNGRAFVGIGNMVMWSEALRPGLFSPTRNFVTYPYEVTMLIATAPGAQVGGVFVGAGDKTYFLAGSTPGDFTSVLKHHAGAIHGTQTFMPGAAFNVPTIPKDEVPVWASMSGSMCVGLPNGDIIPLTDGRYAMQIGDHGSSVFRELNGIRQVLTTFEPPTANLAVVAEDQLEITVLKNGVPV